MNLTPLIKSFIDYMIFEKGCSKSTSARYKADLLNFNGFIQEKNITSLEEGIYDVIVSFLYMHKEKGMEPSTIRSKLSCLKSFFRFLKKEKEIKKNVLASIALPKLPFLLPDVLTAKECKKLMETPHIAFGKRSRMRFMHAAALELLYGSGLRVSELCNAKIGNIDLKGKYLKVVQGKGKKDRIVPITETFVFKLQRYWKKHRKASNLMPSDYIFLNKYDKRVTRYEIWGMVKRHGKTCEINKNIYPHMMRHSCASHLVQGGADIRIVQDILGHADIGTTGVYLNFDTKHLSKEFKKTHKRYPKGNIEHPIAKERQVKISQPRPEDKRLEAERHFLKRAKEAHGDKYDLSKTFYKRASEKVDVICIKHGNFRIRADMFVNGQGCYQCGIESMKEKKKMQSRYSATPKKV